MGRSIARLILDQNVLNAALSSVHSPSQVAGGFCIQKITPWAHRHFIVTYENTG